MFDNPTQYNRRTRFEKHMISIFYQETMNCPVYGKTTDALIEITTASSSRSPIFEHKTQADEDA
jgi:hypothetical protein